MTSGIDGEDTEWFEIMQAFPAHSGPLSTWTSAPLNSLKPNNLKKRSTAQITSRCCISYIYSTNIRTEYFKHAA